MTDAALTLRSKLEELERVAIEKRNHLVDHLRSELRKIKEDYGRKELLDSLGKFPTLWAVGHESVEDLPPTADDTAAALLQVNLWTTGPRH
jgi:hypothetical protein